MAVAVASPMAREEVYSLISQQIGEWKQNHETVGLRV